MKRRQPQLPLRRLAFGVVALCAVASAPAASQAAASSVADAGGRLAYVDPGSGSFVLQALIATLAGAAVAISAYWAKIKRAFSREVPEPEDDSKANLPDND